MLAAPCAEWLSRWTRFWMGYSLPSVDILTAQKPPQLTSLPVGPLSSAGVAAYLSPKVSGFLMKKELDYLGELRWRQGGS